MLLFAGIAVLTACSNGGGTGGGTDTATNTPPFDPNTPALPIPSPTPVPDPEPGPVTPGFNAPQNLSASEGVYADKIEIRWEAVAGATYKVFRKSDFESSYSLIHSGAATNFSDTTATAGLTYRYAVKAVNAEAALSALSEFDHGWRAFSEGCAAKINDHNTASRIGLMRNGFRAAEAIAIRENYFFIAGGGRIVMLNRQRDTVGVYKDTGTIQAMVSSDTGPVYALAGKRILKLTDACDTEIFATLPYNTQGFDITLDTSGHVYASEQGYEKTPRIFRYNSGGQLINEWDFPNGGSLSRSLNSIHWIQGDSLLIADRTQQKLQKYQIANNQLIKTAEKDLSVIGEPTDIATYGNNILVFVKSNDKMHLIRYHSGFEGGSVTYDIGSNWRTHITEGAIHPASGTLFATDSEGRSLFACHAPLFICGRDSVGVKPTGIAADQQKNLYVLHAAPTGSVMKLNANGAHLGMRALPDYQNRAVTPYGIEADGENLFISATNGQKTLLLKIKNDLSGLVSFTERSGNGQEFFDLSAAAGRIVSEQREGYVSGDEYLTRAVFEAMNLDGSITPLPSYSLPGQMLMPLSSKMETCLPGSLYYQVTGFDDQLRSMTHVARLMPGQDAWLPVSLATNDVRISEVRCARNAATLFSLDIDTAGNLSVAQRDTDMAEIRRFGSARSMIAGTFAVAGDGSAAFAATADAVHRFAPAEMSAAGL